MADTHSASGPLTFLASPFLKVIHALERVSYDTLISTPARIFIAVTFLLSGRTKVEGLLKIKASTYYLFANEYALPIIPYRIAAHIATYSEHLFPILLIIGFASRLAALPLLGMTIVIEIFVYPGAWPTHLLWASALVFVIFRGPGALSIDYLIRRALDPTIEQRS